VTAPQTGCIANFLPPTTTDETTTKTKHARDHHKRPQREHRKPSRPSGDHGGSAQTKPEPRDGQQTGPQQPDQGSTGGEPAPPLQTEPSPQEPQTTTPDDGTQTGPGVGVDPSAAPRTEKMRDARLLMSFLVGERDRGHGRGKR